MKKIMHFVRDNVYEVLLTLLIFVVQALIYWASKLINANLYQYDLTIKGLDDKLPFINWFIIAYVGCYPWWYLGLLVPIKYNKDKFFRYIFTSLVGYVICGITFCVFPTTIIRPTIENNNILNMLVNLIYSLDTPTNLFPSVHCFISWNLYVSIRGDKKVPFGFRLLYLILAILVFLSTVFIKQHYVVDIFAAIFLVEVLNFISCKTQIHTKFIVLKKKYTSRSKS